MSANGVILTVPIDGMGDGAYLIGDFDARRANDQATFAITGVEVKSGTVLGQVTATKIYAPLAPAANDGTQNAVGILYGALDISAAVQRCAVTARDQPVNGHALVWPAGITDLQRAAAIAQLETRSIMVRY